jgi:putative chitinase
MPVNVTLDHLAQLAPRIRPAYREAFAAGQPVLDYYAISDSPLRVAHFMAQVLHESGAMTLEVENLHYSPARLVQVWPCRFKPLGSLEPAAYAYDARKLANEVYGGRMGNTAPQDGFTYRGRGLLQLTGKDSYASASASVRMIAAGAPDFVADPDAVLAPAWCLRVAAAAWATRGCNALADIDDLEQITRRINGGTAGFAQRYEWTRQTRFLWY